MAGVPFGDRHHQPHVAVDQHFLDLLGLSLQLLYAGKILGPGSTGVHHRAELCRLMLEGVHFAEQVHLLLTGQERVVVDALQDQGDARGGLDPSDVPAPANGQRRVEDH